MSSHKKFMLVNNLVREGATAINPEGTYTVFSELEPDIGEVRCTAEDTAKDMVKHVYKSFGGSKPPLYLRDPRSGQIVLRSPKGDPNNQRNWCILHVNFELTQF